jgi:hypothetical protein
MAGEGKLPVFTGKQAICFTECYRKHRGTRMWYTSENGMKKQIMFFALT